MASVITLVLVLRHSIENCSNYELAKYPCSLLQPYIPTINYCTQDSFIFVNEIQDIPLSGNFMVSFDVESLFTNIPLNECIDLAVRCMKESNTDIKSSATELKTLLRFATAQTHFLFKGSFYVQVDGVSMGSPLAPVLANLFMGHNEKDWIENYKGSTGLLTNYFSFTLIQSGRSSVSVRTLVDRVYKINNSWLGFHKDIKDLTVLLFYVRTFSLFKLWKRSSIDTSVKLQSVHQRAFRFSNFKLPYVGSFTREVQKRLRKLFQRYGTNLEIKLAFSSFKVCSMLSVKDPVPLARSPFARCLPDFMCRM